VGSVLYIRVVQMQFPIVFFESTIASVEVESGQLQSSDAARKWHDVLLGAEVGDDGRGLRVGNVNNFGRLLQESAGAW